MRNSILLLMQLLVYIFMNPNLHSQSNYLPGYIIENNGDTLTGFIDYRNWDKNPNQINFKNTAKEIPISYKPLEIREFRVDNEIYISSIVQAETSPRKTSSLTDDPMIKIRVDTIFLQTFFRGKKDLYLYRDPIKLDNFYIKQDSVIELLIHKNYLKEIDNKTIKIENKNYLGRLSLYLSECESIHNKLKLTTYDSKSLFKLFRNYYNCIGDHPDFLKQVDKVKFGGGLLLGVSLTGLKFESTVFPQLVNTDYSKSLNLSSGVFFNILMPRNLQQWSMRNELIYSSYNTSGEYEEFAADNDYTIYKSELGFSYLKLNTLFQYKYPASSKTYAFGYFGISNGYKIGEKNSQIKEYVFYSTTEILEEKLINDIRDYEQGLVLGLGLNYNKYFIDIRLERSNGMSDYTALKSKVNRLYLFVGYTF